MVPWPSGKARVCKTLIPQFKSGRYLQEISRQVFLKPAGFCVVSIRCDILPLGASAGRLQRRDRALPRLDGGFCSSEQTAPERGRQKEARWRKYLEIRSFFGFLCKRLGKMLAVCRAMGYNSPKVAALPGLSSPVLPAPWADGNRRIRSAGPAESGCKRWVEMA